MVTPAPDGDGTIAAVASVTRTVTAVATSARELASSTVTRATQAARPACLAAGSLSGTRTAV